MVNTLDHLPPLPLFVRYHYSRRFASSVEQDELGIYDALRLHGRIRHIELDLSYPIWHNVLALMNENFPILERLSFQCPFSLYSVHRDIPPALPKAFLAPNLRQLYLFGFGPPKRLRALISTVSLVTLTLSITHTSSYFRPRLLVARLRSLPLLEELAIYFFISIPRPSTERELLGENRDPITLPSLKTLWFKGVGAYLESLVAQIRAPLLEKLTIWLFNQIALVLPHLFYLINNTKVFKLFRAYVTFYYHGVSIAVVGQDNRVRMPFLFNVGCMPLDWQIDCSAQICHGLIPMLSGVEELMLALNYLSIPTEMRNGAIDNATWHDLLRPFIAVKKLIISSGLFDELSRALQVDEVRSDPSFLPNLQSIHAAGNQFTSFTDSRQAMGRPVQVKVELWR